MNHSGTKQQTDSIRSRMMAIRQDLPSGIEETREEVSNLTDWKYYVRSYPELVLPAVAIAAYSLVPQARATPSSQIAFLDSDKGVQRVKIVEQQPQKSFIAGIATSLLSIALRQGSALAIRQLAQVLQGPKHPG
jgi:hypothetical protein